MRSGRTHWARRDAAEHGGVTMTNITEFSEAPGVPFGVLGTQRRIATATSALRELSRDELMVVLSGLRAVRGRAWASCLLRDALDDVERN